jgi:hypothetical protein
MEEGEQVPNSFGEEVGVDVLWVAQEYIGTFPIAAQALQHLQEGAEEDMPCYFDASHQVAQVWPSRRKGISGYLPSLRAVQELRIAQQNMLALLAEFSRPFGLELP